jgi:hypothetical protein
MIELKPCPFCGGKARLFVSNGVRVLCTKCGATTWTAADSERVGTSVVEDVIKAWNRWKKTTMVFKKDDKVYGSIEPVVGEHCQKRRYCFNCVLYRKRGTKCCEEYANENPEEVAHLLDFEVIDDTQNIAKVVEKYGEDVKPDPVNHPAHYTSGGIECIDAMQAAFGAEAVKDFCLCNAFKYLWRHRQKNGVEDLKKARWYLNRLIREMEVEE